MFLTALPTLSGESLAGTVPRLNSSCRQCASTNILNNPELASHEPDAMDHTVTVARTHYDRSREEVSAKLKRFLSEVNGNKTLPPAPSTLTPDIQRRRKEREERGQRKAAEQAAAYIDASKNARRRAKNLDQVIPLKSLLFLVPFGMHIIVYLFPEQSEGRGVCGHCHWPEVSAGLSGRSGVPSPQKDPEPG